MSLLLVVSWSAHAATITVPGDEPDLGAAVRAAAPGDTIEVDAGTWDGGTIGKDLTIIGVAGSATTTLSGGGFDDVLTIDSGATVVVEGFTFVPSLAGRAIDVTTGNLTARDVIVRGNLVADRPGAAMRVRSGASLTIEDSILENNTATGQPGGHIHADDATLVVRRTRMAGGNADEGGAIWATSTRVTLEDCELVDNEAAGGGALFADGSTVTAIASLFDGNVAAGDWSEPDGGAILMTGGAIATLEDCMLVDNISDVRGGAVHAGDGSLTVVRGEASGNRSGYGGAYYVDGGGSIVLTDTLVESNEATDGSGGGLRMRADGGELVVQGTAFVGNSAVVDGGGIAAYPLAGSVSAEIVASRFDENTADGAGGGVQIASVQGTFAGNRFCLNQAAQGAGVWVGGDGGAWTNNRFQHNAATGAGGAMWVGDGGSTEVINNTFVANRALDGGAVSAEQTSLAFVNNAVAYQGEGGGMAAEGVTGALTHSLFWDNDPADLSPNLAAVVGADVLFVEPGFTSFTDDLDCNDDMLWPTVGSALIDAGDPSILDPDGTRSDIGAYGGPSAEALPGEDGDGDGYGDGVDCDDEDPSVNPGAEEDCSSIDRDCSGDPYDAAEGGTWYVDGDGDGYGTDAETQLGCEQPEGFVDNADDCDDGDPQVNPGALERCNGRDDTCDGEVDEGVVDAWYTDADGDGFGAGEPIDQCDPSANLVSVDGDCDDDDPTVFPGADDEEGDGIDANCDGADGTITIGESTDEAIVASGACGCSASASGSWLLALPLLLVARRR